MKKDNEAILSSDLSLVQAQLPLPRQQQRWPLSSILLQERRKELEEFRSGSREEEESERWWIIRTIIDALTVACLLY